MKILRRITAAAVVLFITVQCVFALPAEAITVPDYMYNRKYILVTSLLRDDSDTLAAVRELGRTVAFMSVSDGKCRAKVFAAQSENLSTALYNAFTRAKASGITPKWFKLDVVVSEEDVTYAKFRADNSGKYIGSMRSGIAFDKKYGAALLEAQINSAGMIDYEKTGKIDFTKVNEALKESGMTALKTVPGKFTLFRTQGYFAENTAYAMKLETGTFATTGRRILPAGNSFTAIILLTTRSLRGIIC